MESVFLLEHLSCISFVMFGIQAYSLYRGSWKELHLQQILLQSPSTQQHFSGCGEVGMLQAQSLVTVYLGLS